MGKREEKDEKIFVSFFNAGGGVPVPVLLSVANHPLRRVHPPAVVDAVHFRPGTIPAGQVGVPLVQGRREVGQPPALCLAAHDPPGGNGTPDEAAPGYTGGNGVTATIGALRHTAVILVHLSVIRARERRGKYHTFAGVEVKWM